MRIRTREQVNGRTAGGHVYSAGEGTVSDIDDNDVDMVNLMRTWVALGSVEIIDTDTEAEDEEDSPDEDAAAGPDADEEPAVYGPYEDRTILQLRDLARSRDLPIGGSKSDLIARLRGESN